jgi:hypothetical protein
VEPNYQADKKSPAMLCQINLSLKLSGKNLKHSINFDYL